MKGVVRSGLLAFAAVVGTFQASAQTVGIGDQYYKDGQAAAKAAVEANKDVTKDTDNTVAKEIEVFEEGNPTGISRDDAGDDGVLSTLGQKQQSYQDMMEADRKQPKFDPAEIKAMTVQSNTVANDPQAYLGGVTADGTPVTCNPVPMGTAPPTTYETTCEVGASISGGTESCRIPLTHQFDTAFKYTCARLVEDGIRCLQWSGPNWCSEPDPIYNVLASGCEQLLNISGTTCTRTSDSRRLIRASNHQQVEVFQETFEYTCQSEVVGSVDKPNVNINGFVASFELTGEAKTYVGSTRDETSCTALGADSSCSAPVETCVDASPETRLVNGVEVTQSCWEWERKYSCTNISTGNNSCGELDQNASCRFDHSECLDDPASADGSCLVENRVYVCSIPSEASTEPTYICNDSMYCMNGHCEQVQAQPSQDFTKAVAALNSISQANKEFNRDTMRIFTGEGQGCSKPAFGISNCCKGGPGVPLIGSCSNTERRLADAVERGLTHYVGTYCSDKFLGVCTSKTQSYCVFQSKLGRIIQEQGRKQLGISWGTAKKPVCDGLTPEQFASLDMSKFDFSEVINDLTELVNLPNETETLSEMQAKIKAYFAANPGP